MIRKISEKQKQKNKEKAEATKRLHVFFLELWDKLPKNKKCICCGDSIWGEISTIYFDHLLEKSKYPELAMEIDNIYYPVCSNCHGSKTNGYPKPKHKEAILKAKEKYGK